MAQNVDTKRASPGGLRSFYFLRAIVAIVWVALAFSIGRTQSTVAALLLIAYPAWDAVANGIDASRNGGLAANRTQTLNIIVSAATAIIVAIALRQSMNTVLLVFGVWAVFAGLLQLATGVKRWKVYGAQWAMILSGGQSALVGAVFVKMANGARVPDITAIAPYAGFGALYFLISAIWLTVAAGRKSAKASA